MEWFKHNLAAILTTYRLVAGCIAGLFVVAHHWFPVILGANILWIVVVLIITAVLTEPVDGRIALKPGWEPQSYWFGGDGQGMNAHAGAGIFGVLPFGILANLVIDWVYRGHVFGFSALIAPIAWLVFCVFFVAMTKKYEKAKATHKGQKAEKYEVSQGWFASLIVIVCAIFVCVIGDLNKLWFGILMVLTIAAVCYLGRKRLFARELERDRGDYS